ncbi:hypothetical protein PISMIDRAFT_681159, partial [Pisolithus microcarpus 441]
MSSFKRLRHRYCTHVWHSGRQCSLHIIKGRECFPVSRRVIFLEIWKFNFELVRPTDMRSTKVLRELALS